MPQLIWIILNEETEINIIRILAGRSSGTNIDNSSSSSIRTRGERKVIRKDKQETKNTVKIPTPVKQFERVREKQREVISEE